MYDGLKIKVLKFKRKFILKNKQTKYSEGEERR